MNVKSEYFYDCEAFLKYLYNRENNAQIERETATENEDKTVSDTAISNWKHLAKNKLSIARIEALNTKKVASIALFKEVEKLCTEINLDNSTSNAKRVFNMLVSESDKLKLFITEGNKDTPLVKYMTGVLNVTVNSKTKNTYVNYLPGRSVDLPMLCAFGKTLNANYKKSGIVEGLKALVGLKLVEAFLVIETTDGHIKTEQVAKEDITEDERILYKLSIKGCTEYMKNSVRNCKK